MKIYADPKFDRQYKKLSNEIKLLAEKTEQVFKLDPFDPRLGTHKLHGRDQNYWSYWITRKIRVKFAFLPNGDVLYVSIGTHDEVY